MAVFTFLGAALAWVFVARSLTERGSLSTLRRLGANGNVRRRPIWSPNKVRSMSKLAQHSLKAEDLTPSSNLCKVHSHNTNTKQVCCPSAVAVKDIWGIGTDAYNQSECQTIEAVLTKMYRHIIEFFASENITEWWLESGSLLAMARHSGNLLVPWDNDADIGVLVDKDTPGALRPHNFITTLMRLNKFGTNRGEIAIEECAPSYDKKGVQDKMCSTSFKVHPGPPQRGPGSVWTPLFQLRGPVLDIFPYEFRGGHARVITTYYKWRRLLYEKKHIFPTKECSNTFGNLPGGVPLRCPSMPGPLLDFVYGNRSSWCVPKTSKNYWGIVGKKSK